MKRFISFISLQILLLIIVFILLLMLFFASGQDTIPYTEITLENTSIVGKIIGSF